MNVAEHMELFVKGSIVGHLVGDALGYPWSDSQSRIPNQLEMTQGPGGELPGEYTSLGTFSLATIASLNECEGLDCEDLMEKFYDVYIGGYLTPNENCYDVGATTSQAINNHSNGMSLDRCGLDSPDNDADALNRMLPIALFYATSPIATIVLKAEDACKITHADISSQVACAVYCLMIRNLILQKAEKVFDTLLDYYTEKGAKEHLDALERLKSSSNATERNAVEDCFWVAWKAFSKYENDFGFAVTEAIQKGNDTNAAGALVGSFAAVANGLNDIPTKYLKTLVLSSEVMDVVITFTDATVNRIVES